MSQFQKSGMSKSTPALTTKEQALLLHALPQIVLVVGQHNAIEYVNAKAELYFNASSTNLLRLTLSDLFHFDSPLLSLIRQVQRNQSGISEYNVKLCSIKHKSSELMDLQVTPMSLDEPRVIVVMQPRTIAQKIERQLAHRGAARSVTGLASMLAHEIRNPLLGIRGAAQLLESAIDPEDRLLTNLICEESDRIDRLVGRMEIFGENQVSDHQMINIHAVLGHVMQVARTGFASNIEFVENYDPSLPKLAGNRDLLIQAFLNLIKNAAESLPGSRGPAKIWITTSYHPGTSFTVPGTSSKTGLPLLITIEDNGPGVPDDIRSILFDPFITTKTSGTGLGLALVAKTVKDHGGIIEHERVDDRTIFKVLLPHQKPNKNSPETIGQSSTCKNLK